MAGAISELARHTLKGNFRRIDPAKARSLILEVADRVLPPYPPDLSEKAERALNRLGVEVRAKTRVTNIQGDRVTVQRGDRVEQIATATVIWAAGVQASPLAKILADATGAALDRACRISVRADLTLPNHPEIFVIGDMALACEPDGKPLPGIAPVAMQQAGSSPTPSAAPPRRTGWGVSIRGQGDDGDHAAVRGRSCVRPKAHRPARLAGVVVHPSDVFGHVPKPAAGLDAMGVELCTRNRAARLIGGRY